MVNASGGLSDARKRILIVDDKPDNLRLLINILPTQIYIVHPASSGEAALRFLQTSLPDLILLDIMMPGLDGYQVCNILKENQRTNTIPVIFISAGDQMTDKAKAFARGGIDYITKPFQPEEVLMRINAHLALRNQQKCLEERIAERTAEVARLNARLEHEVAERKQAQERVASLESVTMPTLIDSKLTPPVVDRLMPIARLEEKFEAACACHVITLVAPAGYGKSTTMARLRGFVEAKRTPVAWISLDAEHNQLRRFAHYLTASLQRAHPGIVGTANPALVDPADSEPDIYGFLNSLNQNLAEVREDIAIFLDDYHLVENEAVHGAMNWLIANAPPNLRLVISSRAALPLRLSKLRLTHDLYEITASDLSLTVEEARPFVEAVSGRALNDSQIKLLHSRTEGWPAGLQLASLALQGGEHVTEFIEEFSGTDKDVTAYLGEIVLAQLPKRLAHFLDCTALFDRFSLALCLEIVPEEARRLLEQVQANNLFLIPLDRDRQWFRYHQLFADYLRSRFTLHSPEKAREA